MSARKAEHDAEVPVPQAEDRVDGRGVLRVAVASLVIMILSLSVAAVLLGRFGGASAASGGGAAPSAAPQTIGTVEQTLVLATARGFRARDAHRRDLEIWAWVDRDAGIARIPVERAMDVVAAEAADGGIP